MTDLVAEVRSDQTEVLALGPRTEVGRNAISAVTPDGAVVDFSILIVSESRDGLISRVEYFPEQALDDALARYAELAAAADADGPPASDAPWLDNHAVRTWRRFEELFAARDWVAFGALFSADSVFEDRRRGMAWEIRGRDNRVRNVRVLGEDLGAAVTAWAPLAVRGERLGLFRIVFGSEGETVTELLQIDEYDEDGLLAVTITFDADDLDAAFAELDERYAATLGPQAAAVVRGGSQLLGAYNAGDFERFRALMVDELEVIDHRPVGTGAYTGADRFVEANRVHREVIGNYRFRAIDIPAVADRVCLTRNLGTGTNSEGGAVEVPSWGVWTWRSDAFERFEYFPIDGFDDALARFRELTKSDDPSDFAAD
jgi:hypothetical protein